MAIEFVKAEDFDRSLRKACGSQTFIPTIVVLASSWT